jgi:hypothetical protein
MYYVRIYLPIDIYLHMPGISSIYVQKYALYNANYITISLSMLN